MKRTVILLALASLVLGTSGCGCGRRFFAKRNKPVAAPVYARCAPAGGPCNTCPPTGQAVSYGYGSTPAMMTMPQMYQQVPMTVPAETESTACPCEK